MLTSNLALPAAKSGNKGSQRWRSELPFRQKQGQTKAANFLCYPINCCCSLPEKGDCFFKSPAQCCAYFPEKLQFQPFNDTIWYLKVWANGGFWFGESGFAFSEVNMTESANPDWAAAAAASCCGGKSRSLSQNLQQQQPLRKLETFNKRRVDLIMQIKEHKITVKVKASQSWA